MFRYLSVIHGLHTANIFYGFVRTKTNIRNIYLLHLYDSIITDGLMAYDLLIIRIKFFVFFFLQLITREQFEDALKEIQDEGIIVVMGKNTIRIC